MRLFYAPGEPLPELVVKGVLRTPKVRVPGLLYFPAVGVAWVVKAVGKILWWVVGKFGYVGVPALGLAYLVMVNRWVAGAVVAVLAVGLPVWWWRHRPSFWRFLGWFYLAQWRRWMVYRRQWFAVCSNLGLAVVFGAERRFPKVVKVRRDIEGDLITVRMLPGQHPSDWIKHAERFAYTFNVELCTVRPIRKKRHRNRLVLHMQVLDLLAKVFGPFPVPAVPDLNALPVAALSSGKKVTIAITRHVLIAGATGAGKGSVLWAIMSALASAIRDGWVQVYGFDPKGGVEFAPGERLFHDLYYGSPEEMAGQLEDLAKVMKRRQAAQRGHNRNHVATKEEPAIVIVIDEFGALTSYITDKKLKDRINAAMSLILSQGRAAGVHVVAALQDPRKEILPFRNLFSTRIALRLNEESEVALILDDDAVDRGAACHQISESLPGVAYMTLEDDPLPVRERFPYHSDDDIAELVAAYAPTGSPLPVREGFLYHDASELVEALAPAGFEVNR